MIKISKSYLFKLFFVVTTANMVSCTWFSSEKTKSIKIENKVTLAWEKSPRTFDSRYIVDADSEYLSDLIHCSLIGFDENGAIFGSLAKEWKWLDPTTLSMSIKDAKYSDGSIVTLNDVKSTYDFFSRTDLKKPSPRKAAFSKIKSIEIKDKNLLFRIEEPDSSFLTNLVVGILPTSLAKEEHVDDINKIVGCGPFKIKEKTVSNFDLVPNEHYILAPKPKLDKVVIKIVKDEITRFSKLKTGEVDLVQNVLNRDTLKTIASKYPDLNIVKRAGLNTAYLGFNTRDPIVGKAKVRRAIAYAIDREKIIKYLLKGMAVPAKTLITPNDPYLDKTLTPYTYDVEKAKKLLDEAGFKDPDGDGPKYRFTIIYKTTNNKTRVSIAKAISADLRRIGINIQVQSLEWGRFKSDVETGKVQMWSLKWVGFKDPDIFRYCFATESIPPNGGNRGWYSNPELDKLLTKAHQENDFTKRKESILKAQKIVNNELPYVFLWHEEVFAVVNNKINNFKIYADGRFSSLSKTTRD